MKNRLDPAMDTEQVLGSAKMKNKLDPATDIDQILGSAKMKNRLDTATAYLPQVNVHI